MTGSKKLVTEMIPNHDENLTVSFGNNSHSKVFGLGKVAIAKDVSLVNVMLVETLGYNCWDSQHGKQKISYATTNKP